MLAWVSLGQRALSMCLVNIIFMSCLHGATTSTRGVQGRAGMLHVLGGHHLPARALEHALGDHRLPTWPSEQLLGELRLQVWDKPASEHGVGPMMIGHGATKSKYDLPSQHQLRRQDIEDGGRPQSHSNTASSTNSSGAKRCES